MGVLIRFPLERRQQKMAEEALRASVAACDAPAGPACPTTPEYVQEPGWFAVRLRPRPTEWAGFQLTLPGTAVT